MGKIGRGNFRVLMRWRASAALLSCLFLLSVVILPSAVHAATTHLTCGAHPDGALATAIGNAGSGDTIVYDQDCTITLPSSLTVSATKSFTLDANGHTVTLDGGNGIRIFNLQSAGNHGPSLTLKGFTLRHGAAPQGGAIFNDQGTLTITNSAIVNNHATTSGAAIENAGGTLTIINTTLSGNVVTGTNQATGGAIDNNAFGSVTITSSTISGNSVSSTTAQSASGGGIFDLAKTGTSLTLTDTIVAGNTGGNCNGADIGSENASGVTSGGHNLIGVRHNVVSDARCGVDFTALSGGTGDQIGTDVAPISPKLGPLANNGGHTQTMALLVGSPALDAGGATCPAGVTTDQRGTARPVGTGCDIGAFESPVLTVQSIAVSVTGHGASDTPLAIGKTLTLQATGTYSDGETADVSTLVQWSSSAPTIATVDAQGVVTGQSAGPATISATIGGTHGTLAVTVTAGGNPVPPVPSGRPGGSVDPQSPPAPLPPSR